MSPSSDVAARGTPGGFSTARHAVGNGLGPRRGGPLKSRARRPGHLAIILSVGNAISKAGRKMTEDVIPIPSRLSAAEAFNCICQGALSDSKRGKKPVLTITVPGQNEGQSSSSKATIMAYEPLARYNKWGGINWAIDITVNDVMGIVRLSYQEGAKDLPYEEPHNHFRKQMIKTVEFYLSSESGGQSADALDPEKITSDSQNAYRKRTERKASAIAKVIVGAVIVWILLILIAIVLGITKPDATLEEINARTPHLWDSTYQDLSLSGPSE